MKKYQKLYIDGQQPPFHHYCHPFYMYKKDDNQCHSCAFNNSINLQGKYIKDEKNYLTNSSISSSVCTSGPGAISSPLQLSNPSCVNMKNMKNWSKLSKTYQYQFALPRLRSYTMTWKLGCCLSSKKESTKELSPRCQNLINLERLTKLQAVPLLCILL